MWLAPRVGNSLVVLVAVDVEIAQVAAERVVAATSRRLQLDDAGLRVGRKRSLGIREESSC